MHTPSSRVRALRGILGLSALMAVVSTAMAATITVTDLSDSVDNLNCDAQCTFREANLAAQNGDTIEWSNTLSFPATTLLVGVLTIDKDLTINGPGAHKLELNAQNQSRVMTIQAPAAMVSINGLTLSHGRVAGAGGGQHCYEDPMVGLLCSFGLPGDNTAGGCIYSSVAQLSLSKVNVHHCMLISGRGGHGGSIGDPNSLEVYGFSGGNGGHAYGGAIYSSGALSLVDSSIHTVSAMAGGGGNGGIGRIGFINTGASQPGPGGHGGRVEGGALYSIGGAILRNVTMIVDQVIGGFGGYGGIRYDEFGTLIGVGQGGTGGGAIGAIWVWQGASKASFSTFLAGDYDIGVGGASGGVDGALYGRYLHANDGSSPLALYKSIFASTVATDPIAPVNYCSGSTITFNNTLLDQACPGAAVLGASLGEKTIGALGIVTLPPNFNTSIAVNGASDCLDADGVAVTHDANDNARPQFDFCDIGAHEVTVVIFGNAFE